MTKLSIEMNNNAEVKDDGLRHKSPLSLLMLGALGVVFGDIGTSPLYAIKETFIHTGVEVDAVHIFRFLSMIFWLLFTVVSVKYVSFVMRANNHGEGGDFALMALVLRITRSKPKLCYVMGLLGIAAGSLFYADAVITPAISVLSAVEGLKIIAPDFERFIVPIAVVIIFGLFSVQKYGTAKVGGIFGPVMLLWFSTLGILGFQQIIKHPEILQAINPFYAFQFIINEPHIAFVALSATVLAVTGAEALYADMGHFGIKPIKRVWFFLVWPCLILNYFGQGALLLEHPEAIVNPFYLMAPDGFVVPLLLLATVATIIASQAVISGAFSLTRQAIQLDYLPRMHINHTSDKEEGQIYIPFINWLLLLAVLCIVLIFKSSSGLAAAYGLAVTGAMSISSLLVGVVMFVKWKWRLEYVILLIGSFLAIDLTLFSSASMKLFTGGYVPVLIALCLFTILTSWKKGQLVLSKALSKQSMSISGFIKHVYKTYYMRVPGTAIYMSHRRNIVPSALLYNLKHNKVLHDKVVFLTVISQEIPYVDEDKRVELHDLGNNFYQVDCYNGFKDIPNVPAILKQCCKLGEDFDHIHKASFFLSRETIVPIEEKDMNKWREHIFILMNKNASNAVAFYKIPSDRVCELGSRYEI